MGHLTLEQRYKIETYKSFGKGITEIADYLGRDKSVIS
jgi:transposase, IS30 family